MTRCASGARHAPEARGPQPAAPNRRHRWGNRRTGVVPGVENRLDHPPFRLDILGPLEQGLIAAHAVVEQRFVTRRRIGLARGHGLAGAQIERDARPASVVDMQLQGREGFSRGLRRHIRRPAIGLDRCSGHHAGAKLTAYGAMATSSAERWGQGIQHLGLFGVDGIGGKARGRSVAASHQCSAASGTPFGDARCLVCGIRGAACRGGPTRT